MAHKFPTFNLATIFETAVSKASDPSSSALKPTDQKSANPRKIFMLVGYRWVSLIPPLTIFILTGERPFLLALGAAIVANLLISVWSWQLNQLLRVYPSILLLDLLLMVGLMLLAGTWGGAFYLYALNPLLIAAFFFGIRGAMVATTFFLPLFIGALVMTPFPARTPAGWLLMITAVVGAYLISGIFGYASALVSRLQEAQAELSHTHRDLKVLHHLAVALQKASDVEGMQEVVLEAVTAKLGFRRAVIGLVDENTTFLTSWLGRVQDGSIIDSTDLTHPVQMPLSLEGGVVATAVLEQRICVATDADCTPDHWLHSHFGMSGCHIFPIILPEQPVGVLLLNMNNSLDVRDRLPLIESIAGQTAVAIGSMMTRLERARETAVHEERIRIAQDLHDTVSQALFGIVFTIDGSLKLLPEQAEIVIPELERALESADAVRSEIRRTILDIWPTTLTAERFTVDLRKYANNIRHRNATQFEFDIRGDFSSLSPLARRSLYRISQEALNNITHHAQASHARICVDVENGRAKLVVRDNGIGFDPQSALNRRYVHDHFGLHGILKRTQTLGGECHIFSQPDAGTSIVVDVPV